MDLILKPRPGGNELFVLSHSFLPFFQWLKSILKLPSLFSGERVPGPLQGGVGKDSGPRGRAEKASQQALCGGAAAARPVDVWQEQHHHCFWTGW